MSSLVSRAGAGLLVLAGLAGAAEASGSGAAEPIAPAEAIQAVEPSRTAGPANPADAAEPAERLVLARAHAGDQVKSVRFLRPAHRIEVLGPSHVLVWESVSRAWLVELREGKGCRFLDEGISLSIRAGYDTLNTSNGEVRTKNGVRCRMTGIREVDVAAMRAAEDAGPQAQPSGGT